MDLREIFSREVVMSYQVEQPLHKAKFWQSGAFTSSPTLRPLLESGSPTFQVPFINPIDGDLEANYSNSILTDIVAPRQIDGGKTQGRAAYLNESFYESRLEAQLMGESPLRLIAGMVDNYWSQQADNRAIATLVGLRNADQANGKQLTLDISKATATAETGFDVDAFLDIEGTMDYSLQGSGVMVVHPLIATKLRKQRLVERVTTSDNLPPVEVYNGRQVVTSTRATKIGDGKNAKFVTYLVSNGAFAADMVRGKRDLVIGETEATGNGGGHSVLYTRRNLLVHPQGFSFVADENTLTGGTVNEAISASWADLQDGNNWELKAKAETTPIRFLITNL